MIGSEAERGQVNDLRAGSSGLPWSAAGVPPSAPGKSETKTRLLSYMTFEMSVQNLEEEVSSSSDPVMLGKDQSEYSAESAENVDG